MQFVRFADDSATVCRSQWLPRVSVPPRESGRTALTVCSGWPLYHNCGAILLGATTPCFGLYFIHRNVLAQHNSLQDKRCNSVIGLFFIQTSATQASWYRATFFDSLIFLTLMIRQRFLRKTTNWEEELSTLRESIVSLDCLKGKKVRGGKTPST